MDRQTTAGSARGFSQEEPSPCARLGGEKRAQVRARCLKPLCSQPAASAGAACPGWRVPDSLLASRGIHRCGTGPAAEMTGGADSLCQSRERSSERPETGTRRKEKTSHARPLCGPPHPAAPHGLCRSRQLSAHRGTCAQAGSAAEGPPGPPGQGGTDRGKAFNGTGANPRLSGPCTERQEKPAGLGGSADGAGSLSALRPREPGSPPAPFACRGRPAAPYNLIFSCARRSIAAHLIHSAVPRDGEGGEGRAGGAGGTSVGIPMGCACSPACRTGTPARAAEGGGFADTVTSAISV